MASSTWYQGTAVAGDCIECNLSTRISATDFSLIVRVTTPSVLDHRTLMSQWQANTANRIWAWNWYTSRVLVLSISNDGGAASAHTSTVAVPSVSAGTPCWLKAEYDYDDGAGNRVVKFWYALTDTDSLAAVTWSQLGSTITTAGSITPYNGTALLRLGTLVDGAGTYNYTYDGRIYQAYCYNAASALVANPNFEVSPWYAGLASQSDSVGNAWTVRNGGSIAQATYATRHLLRPLLGAG